MKYQLISPVSKNSKSLFLGLKEFSAQEVVLLSSDKYMKETKELQKDLDKFAINSKVIKVNGNVWEEVFRIVSEVKNSKKDMDTLINVGSNETDMSCAIGCAAFVNGLKAFSVYNDEIVMLPIMKFSYYKILTNKKMEILQHLNKESNDELSLEQIGDKTKMSFPLISYHINGNLKSEGLKKLGLLESREEKGKVYVKLTTLGRLLVKGYID